MAIAILAPDITPAAPTTATDWVSYKEASLLFAETGLPAPVRTLQRWVAEDGLTAVRSGRTDYVSFSDLLEAHSRRHPAPGL